jgi:hypothetical protein
MTSLKEEEKKRLFLNMSVLFSIERLMSTRLIISPVP